MSGSFLISENDNFSEFPKSTYVTFTVSSLLTAVKQQQSGTYLKTNNLLDKQQHSNNFKELLIHS